VHFEIYLNPHGRYAWRLRASNGKLMAESAESYELKDECRDAILRVKSARVDDLALVTDTAGRWRWRAFADAAHGLADSPASYESRDACVNDALVVVHTSASTPIVDRAQPC
jgi:uncharacterized protein YegP (UPF0339 family)